MKWITRERPKIDRIACPWLITRFIDKKPEFIYAPPDKVVEMANTLGAIPYDIPNVELSHVGDLCSFDAFLLKYHLNDPALADLALIVRAADTGHLELAPQASGLLAISLGFSYNYRNDLEMLKVGMLVYDALFSWCKHAHSEQHTWNPKAYS
ncbi:MAG TPA: chromate resistance protein ChrB domain-containing protein [Gammaproteobacteria bacterium]